MRPFSVTAADDPTALGLDPPHGTVGEDRCPGPARCPGDGGRRLLRLGATVAPGVEAALGQAGGTGQQLRELGPAEQARVELVGPGVLEPGGTPLQLLIGLAGVEDAGPGGSRSRPPTSLVHALPETQALDDERDLARVTPHLADPAPIAARLLAGDVALLAQGHRHTSSARNKAALTPMMPPPTITTATRSGSLSSDST